MITESVMIGSGVCRTIECGPAPGMLKAIVSRVRPGVRVEDRLTQRPGTGVVRCCVTVNVTGRSGTVTHAENSDVSLVGLVAVAVTICPAAAVNSGSVALPFASVVTDAEPRNVCPSPLPRRIAGGVAEELDGERRVRRAVERALHAAGRRRQHREVLEVVGASVGVAGVVRGDSGGPRSMPRPPLEKIELPRIACPVPVADVHAGLPVVGDDVRRARSGSTDGRAVSIEEIPLLPFGSDTDRLAFVPMRFP